MEKRTTLNEKLLLLIPGLSEEDIIVPFQYNLDKTSSHKPVNGLAGVLRDRIVVFADEKLTESIPLTEITEFKYLSGIGCVFMEYVADGKNHMLCRADMEFSRLYASVAKNLNRYMQTKRFDYGYEEEIELYCPKCSRPYNSGSRICANCVDKKHYLARIWSIAKPYRGYIYFSVFMYFVIAAASLITPYLNRVLVDDYIMAETMPRWQGFLLVILSILALNIVLQLLSVLRNLTLITGSNKIAVRLRELVFNKIEMMSLSRISKRTSGELMNRVTGDTNTLNRFITHDIGNACEQIIIFLAVGSFLFMYDWKLALIVILPMPAVVIINRMFWSFMHRHWHKQWTLNAKSSTILHDIFSGIRVVKAFGMEKYEF
ncbi:MAG: ABC transporter transmembrane domain-containing protein, partial [Eubacteriales bacterium]|nr:ABC transporter transmembrane domain-containing protein [Eubacteriales bacterium]